MALDVGTLSAYLALDTAQFDTGLGRARVGLRGFIRSGAAIAAAGGLAIGGAMAASLVKAMNVEAANDKLAAQLGLSEKDAQRAGGTAGRLYADAYGESLEQVNDAVAAVMSSMDLPDGDIEAATANVLNLAKAMEVDVARAAQVAGQMLSTGLAKNGENAADLLTAGLQKVPAALREDLLDAVDEYGKDFAAAGFSGEQAMNLLVAASEKGMYGIDKTGDAIKEFGIRATDMTAASKVGYDALGLSQQEMSNKLLAGGETAQEAFQQIIGGLQGMDDPARRAEAAIALFGTPIEDLGVTEIPKFLDSLTSTQDAMGQVEGAAQNLDSTLNGNAATSWTSVRRQAGGLATDLGERLLPTASAVAGYLAENMGPALDQTADVIMNDVVPAVQDMAQWIERNKTPIGVVAALIGAVFLPALVNAGIAAVKSAAVQALAWLKIQGAAIKGAVAMAVNVARVVAGWVLMGTQSLIQAARMAAAWFIALGPIGWVIAAVIGIVALIVANWDTIVKVTKDLWSKVTKWFSDLWTKGKMLFSAGVIYVRNLVVSWVAGLLTKYLELRNKVVGFVEAIRDKAKSAFTQARGWVVGIVKGWVEDVVTRATGLRDTVVGAFEALRDKGKEAFQNLKDGVASSFDALRSAAAKPVNFLIRTVYMNGIKALADKVSEKLGLSLKLPDIAEIPERRRGGWTPKGTVLVGERGPELVNFDRPGMVYTHAQTKRLMDDGPVGQAGRSQVTGFQKQIADARGLNVKDAAPGFGVGKAARQWNGIAGLDVSQGARGPLSASRAVAGSMIDGVLGRAFPDLGLVYLNQDADRTASEKQRTAMHEIGHVLGLLHPSTGKSSAMKQSGSGGAMSPTAYDRESLENLYKPAMDALGVASTIGKMALKNAAMTTTVGKVIFGAMAARQMVEDGTRNLLGGLTGGGFIGDAARGVGQRMIDGLRDWAESKGRANEASAASSGGGGSFSGPLPPVVGGWMRPGKGGRISSEFGMRFHPIRKVNRLHNGIDIAGLAGSRVLAAQSGRVIFSGNQGSYGNFVQLQHANGYKTGYAHLAKRLVSAGMQVTRGQQIGVEGATGGVTGKHLHFNVNKGGWVNPRRLGVFDQGGTLKPGDLAVNLGRKPETILPPAESQALKQIAAQGKYGSVAQMPSTIVVKDADGALIGRMRVEAERTQTAADRRGIMAATYTSTGV